MNKKYNFMRVVVYQTAKAFVIFWVYLIIFSWWQNGELDFTSSLIWAGVLTGGIMTPLILTLTVIPPEINQATVEQRKTAFRNHHVALKIAGVFSICMAVFFLAVRTMAPIFGLSFWEAAGISAVIGLITGVLCATAVWFIIGLENPPFKN